MTLRGITVTALQSVVRCGITPHTLLQQRREAIVRDLVQLNDAGVVGTEEQQPLACVQSAVWGMLYADVAGIVLEVG